MKINSKQQCDTNLTFFFLIFFFFPGAIFSKWLFSPEFDIKFAKLREIEIEIVEILVIKHEQWRNLIFQSLEQNA